MRAAKLYESREPVCFSRENSLCSEVTQGITRRVRKCVDYVFQRRSTYPWKMTNEQIGIETERRSSDLGQGTPSGIEEDFEIETIWPRASLSPPEERTTRMVSSNFRFRRRRQTTAQNPTECYIATKCEGGATETEKHRNSHREDLKTRYHT